MAEFNIPGVYSKIDASAAVRNLSPNEQVIGIIASGTTDDTEINLTNKAYAPYSFDDAVEKYGAESNIIKLMQTAMDNGAKSFIVVRVDDSIPDDIDYATALDILEMEEAVDIVIWDTTNPVHQAMLKEHCKSASEDRKERIAVVGYSAGTNTSSVIGYASELNSGLVYTAYPNALDINGEELDGIYTAAALAGQIAAETDPSMPMTNVEIRGFFGLSKKLKIDEMDSLILAGVIPLEVRNGVIRIVRAISTYTRNENGDRDITWQELTTVRTTHYIFKDLRTRLRAKFARARQNKATRDAIKSEVLSSLYQYESLEYIENVKNEDVTIEINPFNPLRNDVKFKYDVTGPLNVIHLTGYLVI